MGEWKEYEFHYKPGRTSQIGPFLMPHIPRFEWQLWLSALGTFDTEYYLLHFLYKLLNNDAVAKTLIAHDPFEGETPNYVRLELDHYQFTDYRKEKVTFGLKLLLTKIPFILDLLPIEVKRYYTNELVTEKFSPDNWWRRSDTPIPRSVEDNIQLKTLGR